VFAFGGEGFNVGIDIFESDGGGSSALISRVDRQKLASKLLAGSGQCSKRSGTTSGAAQSYI